MVRKISPNIQLTTHLDKSQQNHQTSEQLNINFSNQQQTNIRKATTIINRKKTINNQQHQQTLQKMANTLLHAPTIQLREGKRISDAELEDMVHEIELELKAYCCKLKSTTT